MSPLKLRLKQDRLMRDAARHIVSSDVELIKAGVEQKPVAERAADMGEDYLRQIGEGAMDLMNDNRGKLAGGLTLAAAALAIWFYRDEIGDVIAGMVDGDDGNDGNEQEPGQPGGISQ